MTEPTPPTKSPRRTWLRLLPGLLITLAAVIVLALKVDLSATWKSLAGIEIGRVLLGVGFLLLTLFIRSLAWRTLLQKQVGVVKTFFSLNVGYLMNSVFPFRLGEVGRAYVISQNTPPTFWHAFSTVVVERIFDLGFMAGILLGTLAFVAGASWASVAALISAGLVVVGFGMLYLMVVKPDWARSAARWVTKPWPRLRDFAEPKLEDFLTGLAVLRDPVRFIQVFFLILLTWVCTIAWNGTVLTSFYPNPTLLEVVFVVAISSVGVAAPSTQGSLGVYEAAVVSALAVLSVPQPTALAYALATHAIYLVVTAILGLIGLAREGLRMREVYKQAKISRGE